MRIKRNIYFFPKKKTLNEENTVILGVRASWGGNITEFSTGIRINEKYWDSKTLRTTRRSTHGKKRTPSEKINEWIEGIERRINAIFDEFERKDQLPTKQEIKERYKLTEGKETNKELVLPAYEEYIKDGIKSCRWSISTLAKLKTMKKHLESIDSKMTFSKLQREGRNLIIEYFNSIKNVKTGEIGLNNRSINKNLGIISMFVHWSHIKGYCDDFSLVDRQHQLKVARKPIVFLTWEELMTVYEYDFSKTPYLERARDVFCFCCFTSLRYSDVSYLRRSNIDSEVMTITTQKTHDTLVIDLNDYAQAILRKYAEIPFPGDRALPVTTVQKANKYIKEIAAACHLESTVTETIYRGTRREDIVYRKCDVISTHTARRTFISNALMLGIPPNIVMKWTGHSDYEAMRPYIEIAESERKKAMSLFNKR